MSDTPIIDDEAVPVPRQRGPLDGRRGRLATKTPEELHAVKIEAMRRWRANNADRVKAQNDKTNGRLKGEWAAKRARRVPMDLLKTGIGTPLSLYLAEQCIAEDCDLHDLTVMASITDPFRWDRGLAHKESKWVAEHLEAVAPGRSIHIRAIHYALLGRSFRLPNGNIYVNTNENYMWLNNAVKSARWLKYVSFTRITDERNEAPLILVPEETRPRVPKAWVSSYAPALSQDDLLPYVVVDGAVAPQPYRLALIAEKSSAREELLPLARRYTAELLLPSGHLSDRMIYDMARRAAADGRPLVCLYATDCDPSGWSMPIILARKLQAHKILNFPTLKPIVHHVGLLPEQVRRFELPDSVLKETDKKAEAWREAFGIEQIELDALIGRHPGALAAAFEEIIAAYFDPTLDDRLAEQVAGLEQGLTTVLKSTDEWREARAAIEENYAAARTAMEKIVDAQAEVDALEFNRIDWQDVEPSIARAAPEPLFDYRRPFVEQTRLLKARRAFDDDDGGEVPDDV